MCAVVSQDLTKFSKLIRIDKVMRILGINKTLETRRTSAINIVTNAMGILWNNHKIRVVRVDLKGDDRCRAFTADPRGMTIVVLEETYMS